MKQFIWLTFWSSFLFYSTLSSIDETNNNANRISLLLVDSIFLEEIIVNSRPRTNSKKITLPAFFYRKYLIFNLEFTIKLYEVENSDSLPLTARLIYPNNSSEDFLLSDDLSLMNTYEFHEYEFDIRTTQLGWYTLLIGSFDELDSKNNIIYDKRTIYFDN